jgi:VanZ family protein
MNYMAMTRQQKVTILALALYWPTLFVLAHIPIPDVVREAGISDKSLHFLTYMILTFLLFAAVQPRSKLTWRRTAPWLTLVVVLSYAICDEYLQRFVAGRSMDARDVVADAAGALVALALLSVFSFWPTLLIVTGTSIYTLAVFTRANVTQLLPVTITVFHLATHSLFTLVWIACLRASFGLKKPNHRWVIASFSAPLGLLLATKASALVLGRALEGWDVVAAAAGIVCTVAACFALGRARGRAAKGTELSGAEA